MWNVCFFPFSNTHPNVIHSVPEEQINTQNLPIWRARLKQVNM